jgi:hypothetical protein
LPARPSRPLRCGRRKNLRHRDCQRGPAPRLRARCRQGVWSCARWRPMRGPQQRPRPAGLQQRGPWPECRLQHPRIAPCRSRCWRFADRHRAPSVRPAHSSAPLFRQLARARRGCPAGDPETGYSDGDCDPADHGPARLRKGLARGFHHKSPKAMRPSSRASVASALIRVRRASMVRALASSSARRRVRSSSRDVFP